MLTSSGYRSLGSAAVVVLVERAKAVKGDMIGDVRHERWVSTRQKKQNAGGLYTNIHGVQEPTEWEPPDAWAVESDLQSKPLRWTIIDHYHWTRSIRGAPRERSAARRSTEPIHHTMGTSHWHHRLYHREYTHNKQSSFGRTLPPPHHSRDSVRVHG